MLRVRRIAAVAAAGIAVWMVAAGGTAAERDLHAGLAYLRAGAQSQAEDALTKYLGGEEGTRRSAVVSYAYCRFSNSTFQEVREYLAATIEENAGLRSKGRGDNLTPGYWSRTPRVSLRGDSSAGKQREKRWRG